MWKLLHCILNFVGLTVLLPNLNLLVKIILQLPDKKTYKYLILVSKMNKGDILLQVWLKESGGEGRDSIYNNDKIDSLTSVVSEVT